MSPSERTQMGVLMEEKKGHATAFDHMMSERRNVPGHTKGLFGQRDELNQNVQVKIAERQEVISSEFERDRQSGEIGSAA